VPGVGPRTAEAVVAALREQVPRPALNMTTGEVLEDAGERP